MRKVLLIVILLVYYQLSSAQNKIEVNYITDIQVSLNSKNEFKSNTAFKISQNGLAGKIRLLNHNNEIRNLYVELLEISGNHKSLVTRPYSWDINSEVQAWKEFEFPAAIPVFKDKTYIISISDRTDPYYSTSVIPISSRSYGNTGNPDKTNIEISGNDLLFRGLNSSSVLIYIYPELTAGIIGQPQAIIYNTSPSALTLDKAPTGGTGDYTYQWQSSADNINWTDINGANLKTYAPPVLLANTWYRLVASCGNFGSVYSNNVLIRVYPTLNSGIIVSDQIICNNSRPASLTQTLQPSGGTGTYTYQWQVSPDHITWTDISGATLTSFSPPVLNSNTWYRLNVTSGPSGTATSNNVLISVNPSIVAGTIGTAQTICYNANPAGLSQITAPSGGTGPGSFSYQWQSSLNGSVWTNISGANLSSYSPPVLTSNTWYRLNATSGTCGTVSSNQVLITVNPSLTAGTIRAAQTICYNTRPDGLSQITPPSGGVGPESYSYQWQNSINGSVWTNIPGANLISYFPPALTSNAWYRLNVTSGSCGTVSSNQVLITVNLSLTAATIGTEQTICYNASPDRLSQITEPSGGTGSYSFQWQSSPDGSVWTNISGANLSSYSSSALTVNTWFRLNITSGDCGNVSTNRILITVIPSLSGGTIGAAQTICFNTRPDGLYQITPPSGGTGNNSFQWQSSSDNSSWTNINNASQSDYSPPVLTRNTWFRRNATSGCTASSNSVRINMYPQVGSAQLHDDKTISENTSTTFNIGLSGGSSPYTVNYMVNGIPQQAVTNYVSGNNLSTGILTAGTYIYSLTSVRDLNGCNAQSLGTSITITVLGEQVTSLTNKALIVVNSASSSYSNYTNYIKPYLDNFGIPYDVCNVNTTSLPSFNDYAIIVFGHKDVYSSGYPITRLETAISAGVGLCSFDPHLFDYSSGFNSLITQRSASSNQINISNYSHYVTQYHAPDSFSPNNNVINLLRSWNVIQRSNLIGGIDLATLSSLSLLQVSNYGNGRIVKWSSYDWMFESILGPVYGMDDLIWRGIVWAARKPFVIQGMPPFITMRVDDSDGDGGGVIRNFEWVKICNEYGIIPWCGTFNNNIPKSYIPTLKSLIDNNLATASPHAFGNGFIYFNHDKLPSFDPAANARAARDFYVQNGLRISKYFVPHYYEVSSAALPVIRSMGGEFIGIHMLPDNFYNNPTPWINCAPFRINRYGMSDNGTPVYYSGYLELNGIEFFNCLTEIRDDGGYEWYPDNNVTTTVARGIRHLRRSLNSMVLASLFTHEHFFVPISSANWRDILGKITSAISGYNPEYKSMDYAVTYVRAKQNIRITNVTISLSDIEISYTGDNDLDTKCYLFTEQNGQITYRFVVLPRVNGSNRITTWR